MVVQLESSNGALLYARVCGVSGFGYEISGTSSAPKLQLSYEPGSGNLPLHRNYKPEGSKYPITRYLGFWQWLLQCGLWVSI